MMVQIVFTEQNYTFANGELFHHWNVQLFPSGQVVGKIDQIAEGGRCQLTTYGNHPGGNRYRVFENVSEAQAAAAKWGNRRFR